MSENKSCSAFLGVHVAERVLSKIFKDVTTMPYANPGYDFVCNKEKKIDVKCSCKRVGSNNGWEFHIRKNTVADFFLCLAFDNREDLTPLHVWLVPGGAVNHLQSTNISESSISRWAAHEIGVDKVVACCDSMRGT